MKGISQNALLLLSDLADFVVTATGYCAVLTVYAVLIVGLFLTLAKLIR